ncbi:APC family permease [Lysobacter niastensis]|uniref:Arginine/agmatine antiporter n=1 Tax=Lysobacter niastensis TaxID=380629 RepID=A0ABS0B5F8_9GAMM|nr:amino acid permease [Lysobacter niastensis]MBF6024084.1 amino acid permease [Lysobacter niastensis]
MQDQGNTTGDTQAGRKLGFWMCTALVVGNTIGIGIFMLPASLAPYGHNAMFGWVITVLGCVAMARVFARLARDMPAADGPYGYIRGTLGEIPAFVAMWSYWVSLWITNAAISIGVVGYLDTVFPALQGIPPALQALALLWLFVMVNLLGVRTGGRVQVVTTVLKLLPMLAVAVLGVSLLVTSPSSYTQHASPMAVGLHPLMAASTIALFAMLGFESATVPADRVKDPGRTIPRATIVGTLVTAGIYLLVSAIPLLLIPATELAASKAPFADLLDRLAGPGYGRVLALFVIVSGLGALNGWVLLVGELTRTIANNGGLPSMLAHSNRHGAPARALLVTGVLASAMVLMNYSKSLVQGFTFITTVVTAANLPLYLCCAVALMVLWKRGQRPAGSDLMVLAIPGLAYVVFAFIGLGHEPFLWAIALAAAGLPVYGFLRMRGAATPLRSGDAGPLPNQKH